MKGSERKGKLRKEKGIPRRKTAKRARIPLVLSLAAALLLVFSAANSSRAALTYYSENYSAEFQMFDIGVTLLENGNEVSWRNYARKDDEWQEGGGELLSGLLDGENGGKIQPGKAYSEELSVRNSGSIDEYVRVAIYRYWEDGDGNRVMYRRNLLIWNLQGTGGWRTSMPVRRKGQCCTIRGLCRQGGRPRPFRIPSPLRGERAWCWQTGMDCALCWRQK